MYFVDKQFPDLTSQNFNFLSSEATAKIEASLLNAIDLTFVLLTSSWFNSTVSLVL